MCQRKITLSERAEYQGLKMPEPSISSDRVYIMGETNL